MINASKEFRSTIKNRTNFIETAKITFKDGRILNLNQEDFSISGNTVSDSAGSTSFPLGVAVGKIIRIEIFNDNDRLSSYDFYEAVIDLRLSLELSENREVINYGTYTVIEPETYGETVIVQAMDNMYNADKDYSTSLNFPVSLGTAMLDSAQTCGVTLLTTTFKNDDFMIQQEPKGITHRTFWAMAAMIACGFARINYNGQLCINSYDFSAFNEGIADLDGGIFDGDTPYSSGDDADGGTFNPWNTGYEYDSGLFSQMENYHVFYDFGTLTVATDDVVITGIETTVDETRYLSGNEGYTLSVENQLIAGQEQSAIDLIAQSIVGIRFRPFEGEHIAYPLAEFGDLAYVIDRKNNAYQTILTDVDFEFSNVTTFKCSAESPLRNSSKYNSQLTQAVVLARKDTEKQLSSYDLNVQNMTSIMANSLGLFESHEDTENGGRITYQHNKPNREDSNIIWRKSEQGFQVSTDGGNSWNAGITADGNAVLNVLSVIGIRFDWAQGGTLTLGGSGNGNGELVTLNENGEQIVKCDKNGLVTTNASVSGSMTTESEKYKTQISSGVVNVFYENSDFGKISPVTVQGEPKYFSFLANSENCDAVSIGIETPTGSTGNVFVNNGANPYGSEEKVILKGNTRIIDFLYFGDPSSTDSLYMFGTESSDSLMGEISVFGDFYVYGSIGSTIMKNRIVDTQHYGKIKLYSIESASPYFSDMGSATIGEKGEISIFFDPPFFETVNLKFEYQVFLTPTSHIKIHYVKKKENCFVVFGESGATFDWIIYARQAGFENERLENADCDNTKKVDFDESIFKTDDAAQNIVDSMVKEFNSEVELL